MAERISAAEFERQANEYTLEAVQQLNAAVRAAPEIGARSDFFANPENVEQGLPVFQGKHTRFVYDEDEEEIVGAVDVTEQALASGPRVRTVAELDADIEDAEEAEEEEEQEEQEEEEEEYEDDTGVTNEFYEAEDEDEAMDEHERVEAMLQDVEMELAAVALDQQQLLARAAAATSAARPSST